MKEQQYLGTDDLIRTAPFPSDNLGRLGRRGIGLPPLYGMVHRAFDFTGDILKTLWGGLAADIG